MASVMTPGSYRGGADLELLFLDEGFCSSASSWVLSLSIQMINCTSPTWLLWYHKVVIDFYCNFKFLSSRNIFLGE
jgi:hypothetical protein